MITWTYQDYKFANWFIPTALSIITSIILWILPKNSYLFVIDRVLGLQKCARELSKSDKSLNNIEEYPLIEKIEVDIYDKIIDLRRNRSHRFFIWFLTSLTISILWTLMFQKLILSTSRINNTGECSDFTADCFLFQNQKDITPYGPYTCKSGQIVNLSIQGSIWCYKWVYNNKGISDILETLGICGGLLSIISSIVPFLYHLFSNKKYFPCSIAYGLICIGILIILGLQKIRISFLAWLVIYLTTGLSILSLLCVLVKVHQKRKVLPRLQSTAAAIRRSNMRRRTTVTVISEYSKRSIYN